MTDMMVDPDTLDAFMEANPLPNDLSPTDAAQAPAEDAHVKGETAGQMLERLGMDGAKWAAEFRTTALRLGYSDMDEGWLVGWFCNAIMAGHDRSAAQAREAALREAAAVADEHTFGGPAVRNAILALIDTCDY